MLTLINSEEYLHSIYIGVYMHHFFEKHSINTDTHMRMSTHPYEYTYAHPTLMSTSERLSWFNFKIHEVSYQERLVVDEDVASH
jgi:hypothetical protein